MDRPPMTPLRFYAVATMWIAKVIATFVAFGLAARWISMTSTLAVAAGLALLLLVVLAWATWIVFHVPFPRHVPSGPRRVLGLAVLAFLFLGACTRIDPGHVGIKVNYYGSGRGVEDFPAVTGMVWYAPWSTSVFVYPTFVQTAVWTHSLQEGKALNEEITFNSKEGLVFTADVSLSYHLEPAKVPHFYVKFRSDDIEKFTHGYMRNIARDAFNEVAVQFNADEIYGIKKEAILDGARVRINKQLDAVGIVIDQFGFVGAPRPPENVIAAINAKIKATQDAIRVENAARSATAEAQKTVATAEGAARSTMIQAEAQAKANDLLSRSLTPALVQYEAIKKWNGVRPTVEGSGAGLLMTLPTPK